MFEVSMHANDSHGVGSVAVVAPDWSLTSLTHAVTNLSEVELVQEVLIKTGIFVNCVILAVTITGNLCWPVVELNLVTKLNLVGCVGGAIAVDLLVVDLDLFRNYTKGDEKIKIRY